MPEVDIEIEGDAFFPALDDDWTEQASDAGTPAEGQPHYRFVRYERSRSQDGMSA